MEIPYFDVHRDIDFAQLNFYEFAFLINLHNSNKFFKAILLYF